MLFISPFGGGGFQGTYKLKQLGLSYVLPGTDGHNRFLVLEGWGVSGFSCTVQTLTVASVSLCYLPVKNFFLLLILQIHVRQ